MKTKSTLLLVSLLTVSGMAFAQTSTSTGVQSTAPTTGATDMPNPSEPTQNSESNGAIKTQPMRDYNSTESTTTTTTKKKAKRSDKNVPTTNDGTPTSDPSKTEIQNY